MLAPKNKTGGVVTSTVMGVGGLIIAVIIILVITSTMFDADLFKDDRFSTAANNGSTVTTVNETGAVFGNYTLPGALCSVVAVYNMSVDGTHTVLNSANYTVTSDGCTIACNSCSYGSNNTLWYINSTTTYYGKSEGSARDMQGNFTDGINNVSEKIPTILLIVAVVFLFGALILLVRNANAMGIGGGGSL